jgi:hypothetical protein
MAAVIGEEAYRMTPLKVEFAKEDNSAVLILGEDRDIASSLCASFALSLLSQKAIVHLFNGDRTKIKYDAGLADHPFMYICKNASKTEGILINHNLNELKGFLKGVYEEYMRRNKAVQTAGDDEPDMPPLFVIVNDLCSIDDFESNAEIEINGLSSDSYNKPNCVQDVIECLVKRGGRYNIHMILAIREEHNLNIINDKCNAVMFDKTSFADEFENSYYLKEMLKNISNDGEPETMAVWYSHKRFTKIRPIIYKILDENEASSIDALLKGDE